jgi:hypothetical protein
MTIGRNVTADELNTKMPGLLDALERRGVAISNNAGAIIVDGYIGDIFSAITEASEVAAGSQSQENNANKESAGMHNE